jgi:hypothetical protein
MTIDIEKLLEVWARVLVGGIALFYGLTLVLRCVNALTGGKQPLRRRPSSLIANVAIEVWWFTFFAFLYSVLSQ